MFGVARVGRTVVRRKGLTKGDTVGLGVGEPSADFVAIAVAVGSISMAVERLSVLVVGMMSIAWI